MCIHSHLVDHCISCSEKQDYGVLMKDCRSACGSIQRPSIPGSFHGWICQHCNPDPAQTPELYNVRFLVKKSMFKDQNKESARRFMSYVVETQGEETKDSAQVFREKYPKEYEEGYAAFKKWQNKFMAILEERRRKGKSLLTVAAMAETEERDMA